MKRSKVKTEAGIMGWIDDKLRRNPAARRRVEEMAAKISIRQDLIALRKKRGLTQAQLGKLMGASQSMVAALESESPRNIELRTLVRAAVALRATLKVELKPAA
jgi:DNA-binding XRE family transcriptional regulator